MQFKSKVDEPQSFVRSLYKRVPTCHQPLAAARRVSLFSVCDTIDACFLPFCSPGEHPTRWEVDGDMTYIVGSGPRMAQAHDHSFHTMERDADSQDCIRSSRARLICVQKYRGVIDVHLAQKASFVLPHQREVQDRCSYVEAQNDYVQ